MSQADKGPRAPRTPASQSQRQRTDRKPSADGAPRRQDNVRAPFRQQKQRSPLQGMRTPDYLVIGHITADVLDDGEIVLGGTALYSALTAARLGARVAVL